MWRASWIPAIKNKNSNMVMRNGVIQNKYIDVLVVYYEFPKVS